MRARLVALAVAVAIVATLLPAVGRATAPTRVVDGKAGDWKGVSPLLAGRTSLSNGELLYQDHVYDDYGGLTFDPGAPQHVSVEPTHGGYRYPTDEARYANNVADLLQLRVAADRDRVWILVRLNALRAPDTTIVSIGFDVDGAAGGAARAWPHQAGLKATGTDVVVSGWGTGGDVVDLRTGATRQVPAAASPAENVIEIEVPRSALPGTAWKLWAATGLWDKATGGFMEVPSGDPTATRPGHGGNGSVGRAFNLAFRDREAGPYLEEKQGDAIRNGDITAFNASVNVADLVAGRSGRTPALRPGEYQVVLVDEALTLGPYGEGHSYDGVKGREGGAATLSETVSFQFYGRWQPYGLYVPKSYDGRTRLPSALVLHGAGGTHASYNRQPGFLRDMGERPGLPGLALITPLARGASGYVDYGERSTLLALDDVARRLPLDPDKQYVTGYSMGGYGVFRMAIRYPDRFAAAVSWAGWTGEFFGTYDATEKANWDELTGDPGNVRKDVFQPYVGHYVSDGESRPVEYTSVNGNPVRVLETLRYMPVLQLGGTSDTTVPVGGQMAAAKRLGDLGYRHRFDLYPGYEHFTFAVVDDWKVARDFLGNRRRAVRPRRVLFATSPAWVDPRIKVDLGLPTPKAWWVRALEVRAGRDDVDMPGRIDATSFGIVEKTPTPEATADVAPLPTPNVRTGTAWREGPATKRSNRLEVSLTNLSTATVDLAGAALDPRCLSIVLRTDGPTRLRLVRGQTSVGEVVVPKAGERTVETAC